MPWYKQLEQIVAASEPVTNIALAVIIIISILLLLYGHPAAKALWVVYLVSP